MIVFVIVHSFFFVFFYREMSFRLVPVRVHFFIIFKKVQSVVGGRVPVGQPCYLRGGFSCWLNIHCDQRRLFVGCVLWQGALELIKTVLVLHNDILVVLNIVFVFI